MQLNLFGSGSMERLDERERPMAANKTKRSWSPIKDRKPDGSRDSGLSSDTQGENRCG